MSEPEKQIRIIHLKDQGGEDDLSGTTPEERLNMVAQMTENAWAFARAGAKALGHQIIEDAEDGSEFQRTTVRILRSES
jgi:hypothetical protein